MSSTDAMVAFLRACLDADEHAAIAARDAFGWDSGSGTGRWASGDGGAVWDAETDADRREIVVDEGVPTRAQAAHIARWDPARVLAEVEVKRRILDEFKPRVDQMDATIEGEWGMGNYPSGESDLLVKLLALPYADHPDYREEWRP